MFLSATHYSLEV